MSKCNSYSFEVVIPEEVEIEGKKYKVTEIGESAFNSNCIERVKIPHTITLIGNEAFRHCENLTSVDIPKNVAHIGSYAFFLCSKLKK
ncbi:MAG: leucine-rich repeat domain-containing protein [Paludibacteraceae bacterium]|nr:leucine-rich repeat domain-containing protein [Paludibacteraceae bacterium]